MDSGPPLFVKFSICFSQRFYGSRIAHFTGYPLSYGCSKINLTMGMELWPMLMASVLIAALGVIGLARLVRFVRRILHNEA